MRRTLIFVTSFTFFFTATACSGGGDDDPAVEAFRGYIEMVDSGQYTRLYEILHPAQREHITEEAFVRCYSATAPGSVRVVEIEEVFDENIATAFVPQSASRAITARLAVGVAEDTITAHMFDVQGAWYWTLSPTTAEQYAAGDCL